MATFSVNQARQFYVVNKESNIKVKKDANGVPYFIYTNPVTGEPTRSDMLTNISSITVTPAINMCNIGTAHLIYLKHTVNGGNPVAGQDYILRILYKNYIGLSEEDQYVKHGVVHAYAGMTAKEFYIQMLASLYNNFSREGDKIAFIGYITEGNNEITECTKEIYHAIKNGSFNENVIAIIITTTPQDWILGTKPQVTLNMEVSASTITVDGDEVIWGGVEKSHFLEKETSYNGKKVADMEYFYMGERGDQYRNIGFPNVIRTKYVTDPDHNYDLIDIHYAYIGSNECAQASEKDITIAVAEAVSGASGTMGANSNSIAGEFGRYSIIPTITINTSDEGIKFYGGTYTYQVPDDNAEAEAEPQE